MSNPFDIRRHRCGAAPGAPRMEASMDQSGKGSRFRRVLPFALAGVGVYAAVAYGSSMFNSAPTRLMAQSVTPAAQTIAADPVAPAPAQVPGQSPVTAAVGQVGQAGSDMLPTDAAAATRNLDNGTAATVIPSSASAPGVSTPASGTSTSASSPGSASGLLGGLPVVGSLPVAGAMNNLPLQNVTGSGVLPANATSAPGSALKNIGGLGGVQLPQVNGTPLGGGLLP
jgi:hypothetical protein